MDLSNNYLRYLPNNLLPELTKNITLDLKIKGNQWECDCHNIYLIDLMKSFQEQNKDVLCTRPLNFKDKKLTEIEQNALPCEFENEFDATKIDFGLPHPVPNR